MQTFAPERMWIQGLGSSLESFSEGQSLLLGMYWSGHLHSGMYVENESLLHSQADRLDKTVLFFLLPIVVAFVFIVFILYRARREAFLREKEIALKLSLSELELKVLRSQINPHFIFNCLNSIHHFMHRNNVGEASDYLIKFSRLIRHVLEVSNDHMIPLSEEIGALKWYMELEQLRTKGAFTFQISIDPQIDPNEVHVPPLLIQPFVENAIWHGLSSRTEGGLITIYVAKADSGVKCVILDNGIKSGKKEDFDLAHYVKRNSRGTELIHKRLETINRIYNTKGEYVIENDVFGPDEGTRVILILPYEH